MTDAHANPYSGTRTADGRTGKQHGRSIGLMVVGWLMVVLLTGLSALPYAVIPAFAELFSSFGADLPRLSVLVMNNPALITALLALLLLLALVTAIVSSVQTTLTCKGRGIAWAIVLLCGLGGVALVVASAYALYLPLIRMSMPVGA